MAAPLEYAQQVSLRDRIMGPQSTQVRWITAGALVLAFLVTTVMLAVVLSVISGSPFYGVPLTGIVLAVVMQMVRQARQRWSARVLDHVDTAVRTHADIAEYLMAAAEAESRPVRWRLRRISEALTNGVSLALAIAAAVPELRVDDLRLLAMGESTGQLETMLGRIMQRRRAVSGQRRIGTPLARLYIPFLIGAALVVTMMIAIFVMPRFHYILRDFGMQPRGMTAFALAMPEWVASSLVPWIIGGGLFLLASYWLLVDVVRTFLPRQRVTLPKVQGTFVAALLHRDASLADVCWSLAASVRMGLTLSSALEDLEHAGFPRPIARQIRTWRSGLLEGKGDVEAAQHAGMPPLLCSVLRIGGPQLPESLALLGDFCDTRHARRNALLRGMVLPLVTLMMAGFVLLVSLSVFLPMLMMIDHLAESWRS